MEVCNGSCTLARHVICSSPETNPALVNIIFHKMLLQSFYDLHLSFNKTENNKAKQQFGAHVANRTQTDGVQLVLDHVTIDVCQLPWGIKNKKPTIPKSAAGLTGPAGQPGL